MADRTCDQCGKVFKYPSKLRAHRARKTPCAQIVERPAEADEAKHVCRFCNRSFAAVRSLARHMKGACPIAPNERNGEEGMLILYEHTKATQDTAAIVKRLETEVAELRTRLERKELAEAAGARQVGAAIGENNGTVNAATNMVVVNVFGSEGVGHATGDRIREILDESKGGGAALPAAAQAAVLRAAMLIFSSPTHPENLTAYLPNKRTSDVMVHGEEGWEVQPAQLVLAPMALKALDVLFDKQPYESAEDYAELMVELRDNEARYAAGEELRPILVRNKELLARALGTMHLPRRAAREE